MENLKISESFRTAAIKSNLKEIRRMMVSYPSKNYGKELAWAVANGLHNVVKCLVESGAKIEYSNGLPLNEAVKRNHLGIVKYLLSKGANPNSYRYPLFTALSNKFYPSAIILLENGAIANHEDDWALELAILAGRLDIVTLIIEKEVYNEGSIAYSLDVASSRGNFEIVQYLISKGAFPDNSWAIESAFDEGHYKIVYYLTELALQNDPSFISEVSDYLTSQQREKYAELFTAADFNMI